MTSDGGGNFQLDLGSNGTYRVTVRGNGIVERETRVNGPGSGVTKLSLIPSSFDLEAFDQMFRIAQLAPVRAGRRVRRSSCWAR